VRTFGEEVARMRFHAVVVAEFRARNLLPVVVRGDWPTRLATAIAAVRALT
jgi:nicotinamide riboside kinase